MANLILPHRFVPGQLALASEMNANFEAIETWAGGNLGTTNITVLEARPGGGSILEFNQTANFPVLDVTNSGADAAIDITQAGLLQTGKAVIDITDSNPQAAANTAHFRMTLSSSTNIPAIEVKHGSQNTLTVSRTGITSDVGITTAGTLTANSLSLTQPLSLAGPLAVTAASADALAIKIKGRSSDNTSKVELKSNNDATTYASVTGSTSGVSLNLPDTADSYTFTIGNPPVTKAVINNSGIDGQYISGLSISATQLANESVTLAKQGPSNQVSVNLANATTSAGGVSLGNVSINTNGSSSVLLVNLIGTTNNSILFTSGPYYGGYTRITMTGPGGYNQIYYIDASYSGNGMCATFISGASGVYNANLFYIAPVSGLCTDMKMLLTELR